MSPAKKKAPPKTKEKTPRLKSRIVGHGQEPVDSIMFNPANWRFHPIEQRRALQGVMREVGVVQTVIINKTTGNLIDGHLRVMIADDEGDETVEATYVELSEAEERVILLSFDRLGSLAVTDEEKAILLAQEGEGLVEDADLKAMILDFQDELLPDDDDLLDSDPWADHEGPQEMELQPQEHYDYLVVLARNLSAWERLCEILEIERCEVKLQNKGKRIGLGRAVDAEKLLRKLDPDYFAD